MNDPAACRRHPRALKLQRRRKWLWQVGDKLRCILPLITLIITNWYVTCNNNLCELVIPIAIGIVSKNLMQSRSAPSPKWLWHVGDKLWGILLIKTPDFRIIGNRSVRKIPLSLPIPKLRIRVNLKYYQNFWISSLFMRTFTSTYLKNTWKYFGNGSV